jgi:hypothetical protein
MGTMKIYRKPQGFNLPFNYQRLPIENSDTNFSFCRRIDIDNATYQVFQIGLYFEITKTVSFPNRNRLEEIEVNFPKFYNYKVYVPDDESTERIFCIGNNIELLHQALMAHSEITNLNSIIVDLEGLDNASREGRISILGQTCKLNRETLRVSRRKLDGIALTPEQIERGNNVLNECFELLISVEGKNKPFYIYGDGVITRRGRTSLDSEGFNILLRAYNQIRAFSH